MHRNPQILKLYKICTYVQQFQADLPILHFVLNLWAVDLNGRMHLHLSINLKKFI